MACVLIAACGSAPAVTTTTSTLPPTTTTSAPTTTTTLGPEDIVERFIDVLTDPAFAGMAELEFEMHYLESVFIGSGEMSFKGEDSLMLMQIPDLDYVFESIRVRGIGYDSTNGGPWILDDKPGGGGPGEDLELIAFLKVLANLTHLGSEDRDGRTLHRIGMPSGLAVDPAALGFTAADKASVSITFWATETGEPHSFFFDMVFEADGDPVKFLMTMSMAGEVPTPINVPDDYWVTFRSAGYHYSIAHPWDWEVLERQSEEGADYLLSFMNEVWLFHNDTSTTPVSVNVSISEARRSLEREGFTCGTPFDQSIVDARSIGCTGKPDGVEVYVVYTIYPVSQAATFEFIFRSEASPFIEEADDLLAAFLSTFEYTGD